MPRKIVDEPDFRVVEDVLAGEVVQVLEIRDGVDAMGAERWREFKVDNKHIRQIFGYMIRLAIELESVNHAENVRDAGEQVHQAK